MGRASKDKRDMYYRKAKEEGYRARSAYKLLQLHEEFNILCPDDIRTGVVDLCAAPGSWSQVLAHQLCAKTSNSEAESTEPRSIPRIVAVDLQEIMPIDGVCLLQGDITSEATAREIIRLLNSNERTSVLSSEEVPLSAVVSDAAMGSYRKADLVVCDGAPDVTGMHELDEYLQHHLLLAALNITTCVLRPGGTFVTKMFRGPNTPFLVAKSEIFFRHVTIAKPKSSRNASMEAFMVCQDYQPPEGYTPSLERPLTAASSFTPAAPIAPSLVHSQDTVEKSVRKEEEKEEEEVEEETEKKISCMANPMNRVETIVVPYLACGDLAGYDADMCYDRDGMAPVLPPVRPPTQAPYIPVSSTQTKTKTVMGKLPECSAVHDEVTDDIKRRRVE